MEFKVIEVSLALLARARRTQRREIMPVATRKCTKCLQVFPLAEGFYPSPCNKGGRLRRCKKCRSEAASKSQKKRKQTDSCYRLWASSQNNARKKGVEHTIQISDIPKPVVCKYLGIKLLYSRTAESGRLRHPYAPSIDRIDSSRGYVPGNIQVISDLANRMKQNATITQLVAFAEGVLRVHGRKQL